MLIFSVSETLASEGAYVYFYIRIFLYIFFVYYYGAYIFAESCLKLKAEKSLIVRQTQQRKT